MPSVRQSTARPSWVAASMKPGGIAQRSLAGPMTSPLAASTVCAYVQFGLYVLLGFATFLFESPVLSGTLD